VLGEVPRRACLPCASPAPWRRYLGFVSSETLSANTIREALRALAEELESKGERGELLLVGGAALALLYDARETTKDVDAYIARPERAATLREAAARVATRLGLPANWLNDGAKGYLHGFAPGAVVFDHPSLTVRAAAPEQLLAMKLCAWRDEVDFADARLLLTKLAGTQDEVWAKVEPYVVPGRETKAWYAFLDLWENRS
jgi:Nucleotidyltransferase of unknown function (DUF6036)